LPLEFLDHEIYEIRRSAAMIMHSVDPEDTYTIDINRKKNENFSSLDLTKSRITMISTLPAFVTDIEFIF
jgi:hypothetical protein